MRITVIVLVLLCACALVSAQSLPSASMPKGAWDFGVSAVGGSSVSGGVEGVHVASLGFRVGKILTEEHGGGSWWQGNLEYAFDVHPFNYYLLDPQNVYGASFSPLNLKWNFTKPRTTSPYIELNGGVLFTNHDLPPSTNSVNFQSGVGVGLQTFIREKRAITVGAKYQHISNAGLANLNPGINTLQFTLGFNWFK